MIRTANLNDIDTIVSLGEKMHSESNVSEYPYNAEKFKIHIISAIQHDVIFLSNKKGLVTGGFMLKIMDHWMCDTRMCTDFALFILPEHRQGTTAIKLLRAGMTWAKAMEVDLLCFGITASREPEKIASLYEHVGLDRIGFVFEKAFT